MFIKLSNIYFNVDQISEFCADGSGETRIYDSTYSVDGFTSVNETPKEILALIEAERAMQLRDEFAKAVLQGLLANPNLREHSFTELAHSCYDMSIDMIEARKGR